jgi:hypothetical protein
MSSMVHADGDNAQTSPCSRAAATMGSTTDGLRSTNRSIFVALLRATRGGSSSTTPLSDTRHEAASRFEMSFLRCRPGFKYVP